MIAMFFFIIYVKKMASDTRGHLIKYSVVDVV